MNEFDCSACSYLHLSESKFALYGFLTGDWINHVRIIGAVTVAVTVQNEQLA